MNNVVFFCLLPIGTFGTLQQMVIVSRHGVRGPFGPDGKTPTQDHFAPYSTNFHFPTSSTEWGTGNASSFVTPKMTSHGISVVTKMGAYVRHFIVPDLFLSSTLSTKECQAWLFAYADDNERDDVTAAAFFKGILFIID